MGWLKRLFGKSKQKKEVMTEAKAWSILDKAYPFQSGEMVDYPVMRAIAFLGFFNSLGFHASYVNEQVEKFNEGGLENGVNQQGAGNQVVGRRENSINAVR